MSANCQNFNWTCKFDRAWCVTGSLIHLFCPKLIQIFGLILLFVLRLVLRFVSTSNNLNWNQVFAVLSHFLARTSELRIRLDNKSQKRFGGIRGLFYKLCCTLRPTFAPYAQLLTSFWPAISWHKGGKWFIISTPGVDFIKLGAERKA